MRQFSEHVSNLPAEIQKLFGGPIEVTPANMATALRPQSSDPHIMRGWVRYEQLRIEDALIEFEYALRLDPRNVDALSSIASTQNALGRPEAALSALRLAIRLSPTDFDLARWQRFMGVAHLQLGQDEEAVVATKSRSA